MGQTGDSDDRDPGGGEQTGRHRHVRSAMPGGKEFAEPPAPAKTAKTAKAHRSPRLWWPVAGVVGLIVVAVGLGRFVVPAGGPEAGAPPPPASAPASAPVSAAPTATLPPLPTAPVRPADALGPWAVKISVATGVPDVAMQAYGYAQLLLAQRDPTCHLSWTTLAAVGKVETGHGQPQGTTLERTGRSTPTIVGPPLDGTHGRPLVRDTDAGAFDGDPRFDHTLGPLHLTPALWRAHASDADTDGVLDPNDIDDAALALGRLLCGGTDDLNTLAGWQAALGRYRAGAPYARTLFAAADAYGKQTRNIT